MRLAMGRVAEGLVHLKEKGTLEGMLQVMQTRQDLYDGALALIRRSHEETKFLMQDGFIRPPPA